MNVIHKESLCINCGCCVSECNAMESDPDFLGPAALAKGMRFVGDPRDGATIERLERLHREHGIWDCTRCYFCNERCPKGVDPRDAIAKLGAEAMKNGVDRDMGARHAKWFVTSAKTTGWLRETELVPKTQGVVASIKEIKFAMSLRPRARCRRRSRRTSPPRWTSRARSTTSSRRRAATARRASSRASTRSGARATTGDERPTERRTTSRIRRPRPYLPERVTRKPSGVDVKRSRTTRAASRRSRRRSSTSRPRRSRRRSGYELHRARVGHLLRCRRHPRGRAGLLPPPERPHPRLRRGDGLRHADDGVQRLHAQPAAGEPPAHDRRRPPRAGQRQPRAGRRAPLLAARSRCGTSSGSSPASRSAAADGRAQGAPRAQDRAVLRLPDPAPVEADGLRGPRQAELARADHRGLRRRGDRLPGQDQVLRLPDHPGARGDGARRADPADRAGHARRAPTRW